MRLKFMDFIFVHLEAPDEMGHEGNAAGKIQAIELFDEKIVGTILNNIGSFGDYRILVLSDHPTPLDLKTHVSDPSPFAVLSSVKRKTKQRVCPSTKLQLKKVGILISPGYLLMEKFIKDWRVFAGHNLTKIRVIYADTDAMGIVYHTNYIKWFEVGRNELMRQLGIIYNEMEQHGF